MKRYTLGVWLKGITCRSQRASKQGLTKGRPTRILPRLMALEDRALPSTFTVVNLADSGSGSLRQAVQDANNDHGADTIQFASGLQGTITLTSGQLDVTDSVTIRGPGAGKLTISGNNTSRVFNLTGSSTQVDIEDLTIADGAATTLSNTLLGPVATLGGGIAETGGSLTLEDVVLTNNQAGGLLSEGGSIVAGGGGLSATDGATIKISDSVFIDNRADGLAIAAGGAIGLDSSTLTVQNTEFLDNVAHAILGGNPASLLQGSASGGAIGSTGGSQVVLSNSRFTGNQALGGDGAAGAAGHPGQDAGFGAFGGAILSTDNSVFVPQASGASLTIDHSSFVANQALGGTGGAGSAGHNGGSGGFAQGGAIHTSSDTGGSNVLSISDSLFADNLARGGAGGNGGTGGNGGDGAFSTGGAINGDSSSITVTRSAFVDNRDVGGAGGFGGEGGSGGSGGVGSGGAISSIPGELTPQLLPSLQVNHVLVRDNQARGGAGGQGGTGGNGGAGGPALGGGIESDSGQLDVTASILLQNLAVGGTGGTAGSGGTGGSGGTAQGGGLANVLGSAARITHTLIVANEAQGGAGTTGGNGQGGGLYNDATSSLTLDQSKVILNKAQGGASFEGTTGLGIGDGVFNAPGGTMVRSSTTHLVTNHAPTSNTDEFGIIAEEEL